MLAKENYPEMSIYLIKCTSAVVQETSVQCEDKFTCIALIIVPTKGRESWDSDATMVGNNS